jgi:hypothetical protein
LVLVVAAAMVLPRVWLLTTAPASGVRVAISPYGASRTGYDESVYAASVRQVMDGQVPLSDPFLVNHQNDAMQPSSLWLMAAGLVARATGDVFSSITIITSVAMACALALLYALFLRITGARWAAVGLIPLVLVAIQVFNQADGIFPLRHWEVLKPILLANPERQWHVLLRFPSPVMGLAALIAIVIAIPYAVETGRRRWLIAAAVPLALVIYSYLYYWTAMMVALAGWGCWMLYARDLSAFRRLVCVAAIALLLAVPEFVVLIRSALALPAGTSDRLGLDPLGVDTSLVAIVGQRLLVGLPFLVLLIAGGSLSGRLYVMLFLSPLALATVSGVVPQPWHYQTQVFAVFAIPAIVAGAAAGYRRLPRSMARAGVVAFACLAVVGAVYLVTFQARSIQQTDASFAIGSDEDAALRWVAEHVSGNETVVSPSITTNLYLAALTPASEYLGEGWSSKATDEELMDRVLRTQAAYGYSEDDVFSRLDVTDATGGFPVNDPTGTPAALEKKLERFLAYYTFQFEVRHQQSFDDRVQSWHARFRDLQSDFDVLSPYKADYLYCGPRERFYAGTRPSPGTFVTIAFAEGAVTVYRLTSLDAPDARQFRGC